MRHSRHYPERDALLVQRELEPETVGNASVERMIRQIDSLSRRPKYGDALLSPL
jgi:hypothetical protein